MAICPGIKTRSDTRIKLIAVRRETYAVQFSSHVVTWEKHDNMFGKWYNCNFENPLWAGEESRLFYVVEYMSSCSVQSFSLGRVFRIQHHRENLFVQHRKNKVLPFFEVSN